MKPPAFQVYPRDFMSDANVLLMSWDERGVYMWLLYSCWLEGSIPADISELARICSPMTTRKMARMWARIGPCFAESEPGRLHHQRLTDQREKMEERRRKLSAAGEKGAETRWR